MMAFFGGTPGWLELLVVLLVILLLFGARRLPDLARALGRSLSEFKKGRAEGAGTSSEPADDGEPDDSKPPSPSA